MPADKKQNEIIRIQKKRNNFVMLDKGFLQDDRLSSKAKGILSYLLSKPDNWKVIVKDLINHSTDGEKAVYSGLRELQESGYYKKVPVRDESGCRISHWESVIFECPEEQPEKPEPTTTKLTTTKPTMLANKKQNEIIRIQKKRNNFVMLDKGFLEDYRLSYKAKGILSYLLSKPDNWKVIVKDLVNHSTDGIKAIYSGLRELKKYGYYKKVPVRDENGRRISHWESVVCECPEGQPEKPEPTTTKPTGNSQNSLVAQKGKVEKNSVDSAPSAPSLLTPFVDIENVDIENVDIQNRERNNNYINNNNCSDNQSQKSKSKSKPDVTPTSDGELATKEKSKNKKEPQTTPPPKVNSLKGSTPNGSNQDPYGDYTTYQQIIQENISYSHYLHNRHGDIELIDELMNCMLDVICTKGNTVKINGEEKNRQMVISQYLKINSLDIEHIIDKFKAIHHKITHVNSYLKTMLYTVRQENGHYYTNAVRADGVVW